MKLYNVTLTGTTPLIVHADNLDGQRRVTAWQKNPENKAHKIPGSDERPAWTWTTYCYHDGEHLTIPSDNLMTCLRKAGALISLQGKKTAKAATQS